MSVGDILLFRFFLQASLGQCMSLSHGSTYTQHVQNLVCTLELHPPDMNNKLLHQFEQKQTQ